MVVLKQHYERKVVRRVRRSSYSRVRKSTVNPRRFVSRSVTISALLQEVSCHTYTLLQVQIIPSKDPPAPYSTQTSLGLDNLQKQNGERSPPLVQRSEQVLLKLLCGALRSLVYWKGVGRLYNSEPPLVKKIRGSVNYFISFYFILFYLFYFILLL